MFRHQRHGQCPQGMRCELAHLLAPLSVPDLVRVENNEGLGGVIELRSMDGLADAKHCNTS
jgi:hypothetical protein